MNKFNSLFKKKMTSKEIALVYYGISDSYKGEEKELLDQAFKEAFLEAQHREDDYAFARSGDGYAYCAN